jgi:dolichol-phosphate mannosyltransferase
MSGVPSQGARPSESLGISIVIPCYNEESSIFRMASELDPVLRELSATASVEAVFVDDGSTDATWTRLREIVDRRLLPVVVQLKRHETNRGLGAALRTGFAASRGAIVVTTDSDSTYRYSEIPKLLSRLTPDVAIVTASPYHPDGGVAGVPRYRLVLSRGSSLIYRALVDRRVHTYTALFRAYRSEVVRSVDFGSNGFLAVAEVLVNAMLRGYRVAEYPTVLHARVTGTSKAKLLRIIVAHLRFHLTVVRRRLGLGPQSEGKARPPKFFGQSRVIKLR